MPKELIPAANVELVAASGADRLLLQIRPSWQSKDLINRVRKLIQVDPSSACQRLLNASIHDLREKVIIAGLDIAKEAARQNKLPPIERRQDIDDYPTSKLIDLAHYMGLLSRPEWRRLCRCYEIRRDLEHEDDEYEAGISDIVYIFENCISAVLSKDPVHLLKIEDVKEVIQQTQPVVPSASLLDDFKHAPQLRQEEILKFLTGICFDDRQPDLVRQNAHTFLSHMSELCQSGAKLALASHIQERMGKSGATPIIMHVANTLGITAYLKKSQLKDFFGDQLAVMDTTGHHWTRHDVHGDLLRSFRNYGGLRYCPEDIKVKILKWLVLAYIGVPGGVTQYGNVRHVYYSNSAAHLVKELISDCAGMLEKPLHDLEDDKDIKRACSNPHINRRFQNLLDLVDTEENEE